MGGCGCKNNQPQPQPQQPLLFRSSEYSKIAKAARKLTVGLDNCLHELRIPLS